MSTPFETVHHLCIVVRDIDKTVAFYESIGIGPWHDYPPLRDYTDLEMPNVAGFLALRYKYVQLGQVQLQMVQPGEEDCPQKRFLDTHGEGVFHIGFAVDDANVGETEAKALGLKVLMRGRRPDASGFTYYDTAEGTGGVLLLTRQSPTVE
jgi:catechol 2,3-dioxygenase-like lactoylglutathione lyase family enzyme